MKKFVHGLIRGRSHLKDLHSLMNGKIFEFEKEKRLQVFDEGKRISIQILMGFYIHFVYRITGNVKIIDITYSIKEGNLRYFLGTFVFERYNTKAHITNFVYGKISEVMFDRICLQRLVTFKGEELLGKIENATSSFERAYWESIRYKLKKEFTGPVTSMCVDTKRLITIPVQM